MAPPEPRHAPGSSADVAPLNAVEVSKWFSDEVQPHEQALRGYLRRSFPAVRDVDDVVQESYLRAWRARTAQPIRSVRAFLFTVARRLALNIVDRQRTADTIVVGDLDSLPVSTTGLGVVERVSHDEIFSILVEALATLPTRCREITVLRKLQGIPQREVAERLGISERTVEEQVARGARRCQDYLRRRGITSSRDRT